MSNLNKEPLSWQEINTKLSSSDFKRIQLYLGTIIFFFSCLIIFTIGLLNAHGWEQRIDMMMATGIKGAKSWMFLMTGIFISPYLIGWPFWKLRQVLIRPLLRSESLSEWIAMRKPVMTFYFLSFAVQIIVGYLITSLAYYFFTT